MTEKLPPDALETAAENVAKAEAAHTDAVTARNDAIRSAHKNGATVIEIARRTGLTRQMVYSILEGKRRRA